MVMSLIYMIMQSFVTFGQHASFTEVGISLSLEENFMFVRVDDYVKLGEKAVIEELLTSGG